MTWVGRKFSDPCVVFVDKDDVPGVGEMVVTRQFDYLTLTDTLYIEKADPRAWITSELLWDASQATEIGSEVVSWDGDSRALTIYGTNRTVVYRVTHQYDFRRDCWLMEWPD